MAHSTITSSSLDQNEDPNCAGQQQPYSTITSSSSSLDQQKNDDPGCAGQHPPVSPISLDKGDPMIFEEYWERMGDKCDLRIGGGDLMSYLSNPGGVCWFLLPQLEESIRRIHSLVGNAATQGRYIVVGTGSSQLVQTVLYALSSDSPHPLSVVCAPPYYSCYPELAGILKSELYKWEGDAHTFNKDGPFLELVTSPNNPDGSIRGPVVRPRAGGHVMYDLAYYWPQFTPITHQADHDIMIFTFSKSVGHAGSRIGWAIVKNKEIAIKMVKLIEVLSIGVSKEAQLRATKILGAICDGYEGSLAMPESDKFFDYFRRIMAERWNKLREVVKKNQVFSLPEYQQEQCLFSEGLAGTHPGFAWLKCEKGESKDDAEGFLKGYGIQARGGHKFGVDGSFVRVSMMSRENTFKAFLERLSAIEAGRDSTYKMDVA
ncbi:hypothetical protein SAY86_008211 [Trapa natans]|uniref:Alliinase C-terminal domain-containing protein n=1 Tax=Trapa natans TaxID=22666 RepID=A0AAN7KDD5_TRANT|nr:hypothetical protein SAY86_008211 [Trapa natans]